MYSAFRNKITGNIIIVDQKKMRVKRLRRRVSAWSQSINPDWSKYYMVMITLTYRQIWGWRPNNIRDFIKRIKRHLKSDLYALAWVAELQKRGAVHYHVLVIMRKGRRIPKPDRSGWWDHGMSKIEKAKSIFYLMKYTSKGYIESGIYDKTKEFPKGSRIFSVYASENSEKENIRIMMLKEIERLIHSRYGWDGVNRYRKSMIGKGEYTYLGSWEQLPEGVMQTG